VTKLTLVPGGQSRAGWELACRGTGRWCPHPRPPPRGTGPHGNRTCRRTGHWIPHKDPHFSDRRVGIPQRRWFPAPAAVYQPERGKKNQFIDLMPKNRLKSSRSTLKGLKGPAIVVLLKLTNLRKNNAKFSEQPAKLLRNSCLLPYHLKLKLNLAFNTVAKCEFWWLHFKASTWWRPGRVPCGNYPSHVASIVAATSQSNC